MFVLQILSDYFLPLMQSLRSHIAKWCFISLICVGFGLYMVRPAHAQHTSKAFSSWIDTVVDESQAADLKQQLDQMRASGADIYKLMRHASRHMSKADRDFDLLFNTAASDASDHILQVLLQQWNHYKTGNGMANVPPPETIKTPVSITVDKYGSPGFAMTYSGSISQVEKFSASQIHEPRILYHRFEPMSTGIAIGAP